MSNENKIFMKNLWLNLGVLFKIAAISYLVYAPAVMFLGLVLNSSFETNIMLENFLSVEKEDFRNYLFNTGAIILLFKIWGVAWINTKDLVE